MADFLKIFNMLNKLKMFEHVFFCSLVKQKRKWNFIFISLAKAPALYVTMSQEEVEVVVHFLDLAFKAQIELRNVKVKVTLR